ncbi:MAG: cell division protein FtsW, partial [Sphingobacteriales bacterium BACL12 MAG-120813-bin55]
ILMMGVGMMYLAHLIPYRYYSRISQILLWISVPLLIYTLFFGVNLNDASRWIVLPVINLTFQTSDLARFALIMYTARLLSKKQHQIDSFKEAFVPVILPVIIVCALIFPANLSTAAILFFTCMLLMFVGRVNFKYIALTFLSGVILIAAIIGLSYVLPDIGRLDTWKNRVESFVDENREEPDQVRYAKIAVAKGGVIGQGPGNSTQRHFLPHAYSDFIYAVIIEEYGMLGGIVIIVLFLVLLYRCIRIVVYAPTSFGALLAIGLGLSLTIQALVNMGVATSLLPVTGLTLPLISMGGTSLWFTSMSFGIILSVSRQIEMNELQKAGQLPEDEQAIAIE